MELFKLFGSVFVDTAAAEKSMQKLETAAEKVGKGISAFGDTMSSAGNKLTLGITAPVSALGAAAVRATADFESAMSEVSAISGATGEDLKRLEEHAKEMGKTTKFSASESAEALKYMAMAGWKTEEMLGGLEGIMNLAAASGEDLGTTSDIVTDALTAFGMSAGDSSHFADILATASSNANTNVGMMGETFKYVAPVAGALGFQAEDVALAIGLMANSGIKASQAGTSLRASMTNLANPTKNMQEVMVALGLATQETANVIDEGKLIKAQEKVENKTIDLEKAQIKYNEAVNKYGGASAQAQTAALNLAKAENNLEAAVRELEAAQQGEMEITGLNNELLMDSEGNMRSFREIMLVLRDAFRDLSEEEKAQAAATLFGKEAMSGMLAVINASDEDFEKLAAAIDSADGSAKSMADTMNDNLSGQITLLKSQVESLLIQFGEILIPYLRKGVEWLSKVLDYISGLDEGTKEMIITIGLFAAAAGPVLSILGKGISIIGSVISIGGKLAGGISGLIKIGGTLAAGAAKIVGILSGAATFVTGTLIPAIVSVGAPVLAVVAAVGALVAAGIALYENWDAIKEWAGKVWEGIKDIVCGIVDGIVNFFKASWEIVRSLTEAVFNGISSFLSFIWDGIKSMFTAVLGFIQDAVAWYWEGVQHVTESVFNAISGFLSSIWDGIKFVFTSVLGFIQKIVTQYWEGVRHVTEAVFTAISGFLSSIWDGIKSVFTSVLGFIQEIITQYWEGVRHVTEAVFTAISEFLSSIWDGIKSVFTSVLDFIQGIITQYWEGVRHVTEAVFTAISGFLSSIWDGIKSVFTGAVSFIKETIAKYWEGIRHVTETVFNAVSGFLSSTWDKIKNICVNVWNSIRDTVSGVVNGIKDAISNGLDAALGIVTNTLGAIKNAFQNIFDGAKNIVSGAIDAIKGFFNFEWKLPKIKLPHFKISGSFSLSPPSIPSFGVDWYKDGGVMMDPTVFGRNPSNGHAMVGGEAGPEAIAPINILREYIQDAVDERESRVCLVLESILELLQEVLPGIQGRPVVLDTGALVGSIAGAMDEKLGRISHMRGRRN